MQWKYFASLAGLLGTAVAAILFVSVSTAAKPLPEQARPPAAPPTNLVVHEWGTFTSFSGSNGTLLKFYHKSDDLPEFVHRVYEGKGGDGYDPFNPVSLETPVLYFYTNRATSVSVQVDFPKGMMSEWYPQAEGTTHRESRRVKRLAWKNVRLLPEPSATLQPLDGQPPNSAARARLPVEKKESHYYAARETDAAPVQVGKEQEKFLFYRGVADFAPPLSVQALGNGYFRIRNNGKERATGLVLLNSSGRAACYEEIGVLEGGAEIETTLSCKNVMTPDKLANAGTVMERSLVAVGLYEKEARAMVKTWKADWFGDVGTRLLYVAPVKMADEILPLKIEPKPSAIVRVLVGRHDILTPEKEQVLDLAVQKMQTLAAEREAIDRQVREADESLEKLVGRFNWSAQGAATARLRKSDR